MVSFLNGSQPYAPNNNLNYSQMAESVKSILYWRKEIGLNPSYRILNSYHQILSFFFNFIFHSIVS